MHLFGDEVKSVRVKKAELLAALEKNREQHHAIFLEAVDGYEKEAERLLEEHLDRLRDSAGKSKPMLLRIFLDAPSDHTEDYDAAISMLQWSEDDTVEIDQQTFRNYVLDDWQWKRQFLASNSYYSATAARMSEENGDSA